MRERLFKAKRVDNGEWVEGDLVMYGSDAVIRTKYDGHNSKWHPVTRETVCEYTGIEDCRGNKMFGGDTAFYDNGEESCHATIAQWKGGFVAEWDLSTQKGFGPTLVTHMQYLTSAKEWEITGNIHDVA